MLELPLIAVWSTRKVKATICEPHIIRIRFVQQYAALEDPLSVGTKRRGTVPLCRQAGTSAGPAACPTGQEHRGIRWSNANGSRPPMVRIICSVTQPNTLHRAIRLPWQEIPLIKPLPQLLPTPLLLTILLLVVVVNFLPAVTPHHFVCHFAGTYVGSDYHKITWANDKRFGLVYIDQKGLQVTTEVE